MPLWISLSPWRTSSAFETQALLQLKNEYCSKSRCLECNIGIELMKTT
jgi:hypothetical protein